MTVRILVQSVSISTSTIISEFLLEIMNELLVNTTICYV